AKPHPLAFERKHLVPIGRTRCSDLHIIKRVRELGHLWSSLNRKISGKRSRVYRRLSNLRMSSSNEPLKSMHAPGRRLFLICQLSSHEVLPQVGQPTVHSLNAYKLVSIIERSNSYDCAVLMKRDFTLRNSR